MNRDTVIPLFIHLIALVFHSMENPWIFHGNPLEQAYLFKLFTTLDMENSPKRKHWKIVLWSERAMGSQNVMGESMENCAKRFGLEGRCQEETLVK